MRLRIEDDVNVVAILMFSNIIVRQIISIHRIEPNHGVRNATNAYHNEKLPARMKLDIGLDFLPSEITVTGTDRSRIYRVSSLSKAQGLQVGTVSF